MHQKKAGDLDIILDVLEKCALAQPSSAFICSLLQQYRERGSLSKKQLEGLYNKAGKIQAITPGKLATIQAIILKKPTRYRSVASTQAPASVTRDGNMAKQVGEILEKYPNHKRVLYFQLKLSKNEDLNSLESNELQKFHSLLVP